LKRLWGSTKDVLQIKLFDLRPSYIGADCTSTGTGSRGSVCTYCEHQPTSNHTARGKLLS
jgi:hypothetical protein